MMTLFRDKEKDNFGFNEYDMEELQDLFKQVEDLEGTEWEEE